MEFYFFTSPSIFSEMKGEVYNNQLVYLSGENCFSANQMYIKAGI